MQILYLALCAFIYFPIEISGARILAMFAYRRERHWDFYRPLLVGLVEKGHHVTVVGYYPQEPPIPRYSDIVLPFDETLTPTGVNIESLIEYGEASHISLQWIYGYMNCEFLYETEEIQNLSISRNDYDVLITELYSGDCFHPFAHKFSVPLIGITPGTIPPFVADLINLPDNPSYIPSYTTSYGSHMNFPERFLNTLTLLKNKMQYAYVSRRNTDRLARRLFPNMPSLLEISNSISLIIANTHFSMNGAKPRVPALLEGGGLHIPAPEPPEWPTKNLKRKLDDSKYDVVYFSFESYAPSQTLPLEKLKAFVRAFKNVKATVVWTINEEILRQLHEGLPNNIIKKPSVPQLNVLCHHKVKAFITHGEMLSSQEAVFCGVPMIGIPLFEDQYLNIKNFESQGFAVHLDVRNVTQTSLEYALDEILNNPKYGSNARRVSTLFKDRPVPVLNDTIFWTEYVIKHHGHHLQTSAKNLNWFQYLLLDVLLAFWLVCLVFAYLVACVIKYFCNKYYPEREIPKIKIA